MDKITAAKIDFVIHSTNQTRIKELMQSIKEWAEFSDDYPTAAQRKLVAMMFTRYAGRECPSQTTVETYEV